MAIKYHKLNTDKIETLVALLKVYEEVFEVPNFSIPENDYLQTLLENDKMMFFVAHNNSQVIGGLTAHFLPSVYFPSNEVYIYDLAVKTKYQRQGIGRKLLETLSNYCKNLNVKEVFVQADLEDQHAIDFYKATGGAAERVVHFSYSLKG